MFRIHTAWTQRWAARIALAAAAAVLVPASAYGASLITRIDLTAEARGSVPARPAPAFLCRGEVLDVEVTTQHPQGAGFAVAVSINGTVGQRRFLQFFGDPGPRRITVTAETEQGDLETQTKEILVDGCQVQDLPEVRSRRNPYHPNRVDFTVSAAGAFGPDFIAFYWDFGDGATATSKENTVAHDYTAVVDGTAPYHPRIVQVSNQPIVGGVPAAGSLVRRYALTLMDGYWFSKRKGILQPPATSGVTMTQRGTDLVGSYAIRNLEGDAVVFQYAQIEEMDCDTTVPSVRKQILPSAVIFQGGYGLDPEDPEWQEDPALQAAMDLKDSIAWLPKDAWIVPPVVAAEEGNAGGEKFAKAKAANAGLDRTFAAANGTAVPIFPPIPPPPGQESGFVVVPANHVHEGYLTLPAASLAPTTCNVAYHLVGETLSGQRVYASLYFEAKENPTLKSELKDKVMAAFLKELLDRGLVSNPSFISHEDLYQLQLEGKIRRTVAGWEVI